MTSAHSSDVDVALALAAECLSAWKEYLAAAAELTDEQRELLNAAMDVDARRRQFQLLPGGHRA